MSDQNEPSQTHANKLLRVLKGERSKYTCRVFLPDFRIIEFQAKERPKIKYNDDARCLWIVEGEYESKPIMELVPGSIILAEENPV